MKNRTLQSLIARLPTEINLFGDYYPTPAGLGVDSQTIHNCYWGAIRAMLLDEEVVSDLENRESMAMMVPSLLEGDANSVAFMSEWLSELDMHDLFEQMLHAVRFGFQPIEVDYERAGNTIIPTGTQRRNPWGFVLGKEGQIIANPYNGVSQYAVPAAKVIPVVRRPSTDKPYGESVLEELWPIWQSKWMNWANIERLGQKYAIPSVVALLGNKVKVTNTEELDRVADNLAVLENGDSTAITADSVQVLNPQGKVEELMNVIEYIDKKINKRITGQVLANSTQSNGNRALGEVHERMAMRIALADAKMVFKVLNKTLLRWGFMLNKREGQVQLRIDDEKLKDVFAQASGISLADYSRPTTLDNKMVTLCI
ncbi:hypothetical protein C1S99_10885 [Vibrio parahaemolyticus]|uniref:phage portal protein family protein n=1 Tax=Vibrio parahaemolyticus TaxID=670 RepID=UPI000C86D974|nr:DUF935 family protein [Vibrio parahaemolyticus]EJB8688774.1 DUF935 family protein [Vibrio parahaemolyticus]PMS42214.1 hypothetical protein C1T12_11370 [Vibrio parahaemolyticus]PMS62274.1 hypothetical protein C1S91_15615 [Vibrio parahaemolyticus]PMS68203.1 hypothetical protein C1S96_11800 [Vibrio parahaemolyticus]PMS72976.1 hypothetical protein C1T10_14585 [Vibrio parahaemolyticus]